MRIPIIIALSAVLFFLAAPAHPISPINFTEVLVQASIDDDPAGFNYPFGHHVADINGDGIADIAVCDVFKEPRALAPLGEQVSTCHLFKGDDAGGFTKEFINIGPGFWEHLTSADIDNDGWHEIFVLNNRDGGVSLFARDGNDRPWGQLLMTWRSNDMPRPYDIDAGNLDGDGCEDMVLGGYTGGKVFVYKNPCDGPVGKLGMWDHTVVSSGHVLVRTSRLADFDGDGDLDILVTSEGNAVSTTPLTDTNPVNHGAYVRVIRNPGTISGVWTVFNLDTNARGAQQGDFCDFDGDGDKDIIVAFGGRDGLVPLSHHYIALYTNNGGMNFTKTTLHSVPYAMDADCGDIDGDGRGEVIYAAHDSGSGTDDLGDRVGLLDKIGGVWTDIPLKTEWTAANDVTLADLDNDGDLDIVGTADNGNGMPRRSGGSEVRIWLNNL
jgi:hypothetical protein